ncbi:MAG: DUF6163 family protein [Pseudomonadota bacterium]
MNTEVNAKVKALGGNDFVLMLLRLVSIILLALSAGYWAKLVGISDGLVRFDTMSIPWKVAATTLVVLQPVAALGLWGGWRWGVVVWIITALIEGVMYGLNSDIFGEAGLLLLFHLFAFLTYVVIVWVTSSLKSGSRNEI